jgi:predicted metalloprotease with PDZ domain
MSQHAPFVDAAVSTDTTDASRTFLSYYAHGSAIALALDLTLRDRSGGRTTLDDYMRHLWRAFGAPPATQDGSVARPYSLVDLRAALAVVSGDAAFADTFFDRYVEGHDAADYARLLSLAGYTVQPAFPGRGWVGDVRVEQEAGGLRVGASRFDGRPRPVPFATPAYRAGLDSGDRITSIDGQPATETRWSGLAARAPGASVRLIAERRDGTRVAMTMVVEADPTLEARANEDLGIALSPAQHTFRTAWLRSLQP